MAENGKRLLIIEKSNVVLTKTTEDGSVILEGIFGEIGVRNKNNRIYEESEYLPQIESLQNKVGSNTLLGELDHPKQFDISLSNVSHVIQKLEYDKDTKKVMGRIKLLDTSKGREAKALVEGGIPLHISSRAAGSVDDAGKVTIKKLFTYDLVADPGFENAQLTRVNEAYGFENDDNLFIYEYNEELDEKITQDDSDKYKNNDSKIMEKYVKEADYAKYSQYMKEELEKIRADQKEFFDSVKESTNSNTETDAKVDNVVKYAEKISEHFNGLTKYTQYLAENLDRFITHSDYLTENLNDVKEYMKYVAKKTDNSIQFSESLANKINELVDSSNLLEEELNNNTEYTKYLADEQDKTIQYVEHVAEKSDYGIQYTEKIALTVESAIKHGDNIATNLNDVIDYQKYLKENIQNIDTKPVQTVEEKKTETETEKTDDYKKSIDNKLEQIIESAKKQKAEYDNKNLNFLDFLNSSNKNGFISLSEDKKNEVISAFESTEYKTSEEADTLYESTLGINENKAVDFIENIPEQFKGAWEALTESQQSSIKGQAKFYKLDNTYQVANFWSTRDLRGQKVELKSLNEQETIIKEQVKEQEPKNTLVSEAFLSDFEEKMMKRFNK